MTLGLFLGGMHYRLNKATTLGPSLAGYDLTYVAIKYTTFDERQKRRVSALMHKDSR